MAAQNIFLTSDIDGKAHAKLGDLGLATRVPSVDGEHAVEKVRGTPDFMAPEVRRMYNEPNNTSVSKRVSPRADVFGLGISLFGLVCGGGQENFTWSKFGRQIKVTDEILWSRDGPIYLAVAQLPTGRCKDLVVAAVRRNPSERATAKQLGDLVDTASSSPGENVRGSYYSYIIMQSSSALTGQTATRRAQLDRLCDIQGCLKKSMHGWVQQKHYPIALSDADEGCVRADIVCGRVHSLVWCADGALGWEAATSPENIKLAQLEEALLQPNVHVPRVAIVCMKYGSRAVAERLRKAGISRVFWLRKNLVTDQLGVELFVNVIVPMLNAFEADPTLETFELKESAKRLVSSLDWGLVKGQSKPNDHWTPDESTDEVAWIQVKASLGPTSNFGTIANEDDDLELLACDMPYVVKLKRDLLSASKSNILVAPGSFDDDEIMNRCRSIAHAACESFTLSALASFEMVFKISSECDIKDVERELEHASKGSRLLFWVDVSAANTDTFEPCLSSALEKFANRFNFLSIVMTIQSTSRQKSADELTEALGGFAEFPLGVPEGIPGVTAASLHEEIKMTTNINLLKWPLKLPCEMTTKMLRGAIETVLGRQAIAGLYLDDCSEEKKFVFFVRVHITDVGFLHKVRDRILMGHFERELKEQLGKAGDLSYLTLDVDLSHFAERYEASIFSLDKLTPHQKLKLKECREAGTTKHIHVRAPAGAGKTFIALYLMLRTIEQNTTKNVLFVAPSLALSLFVMKWLWKRLKNDGDESRLKSLFVLALSDDAGTPSSVVHCVRLDENQINHTPLEESDAPSFDMVVVDEAHHLYRVAKNRDIIDQHMVKGKTQRVLLSDTSQSHGQSSPYPSEPDLVKVTLNEVVRSSKRIVAGAMAFQLDDDDGGEKNLTKCHHESDGPPLKTFLFDVASSQEGDEYDAYAEETCRAIQTVMQEFRTLNLDDRLAVIVPNATFEEALRLRVMFRLTSVAPQRHFRLVSPEEASATLPRDEHSSSSSAEQRIILSPIDRFDGLERLIVIAVGLDTPIDGEGFVLETRSQLYRAITRAHMVVRSVVTVLSGRIVVIAFALANTGSRRQQDTKRRLSRVPDQCQARW